MRGYPPVAFIVLGIALHAMVTKDPLLTVQERVGRVWTTVPKVVKLY